MSWASYCKSVFFFGGGINVNNFKDAHVHYPLVSCSQKKQSDGFELDHSCCTDFLLDANGRNNKVICQYHPGEQTDYSQYMKDYYFPTLYFD